MVRHTTSRSRRSSSTSSSFWQKVLLSVVLLGNCRWTTLYESSSSFSSRNNHNYINNSNHYNNNNNNNIMNRNLKDFLVGRNGAHIVIDMTTSAASLYMSSSLSLNDDDNDNDNDNDKDMDMDMDEEYRNTTPWFELSGGMSVLGWGNELSLHKTVIDRNVQESRLFGPLVRVQFFWWQTNNTNDNIDNEHDNEDAKQQQHQQQNDDDDDDILKTQFDIFQYHEMIIFHQTFLQGWNNTNVRKRTTRSRRRNNIVTSHNNNNDTNGNNHYDSLKIIAAFPEINATLSTRNLNYLLWGDCFASDTISGSWDDILPSMEKMEKKLFNGDTYGQPWIIHDTKGRTSIWSNLDHYFVSGTAMAITTTNTTTTTTNTSSTTLFNESSLTTTTSIQFGLRSTLQSIPQQLNHRSVFVGGRHGINATLMDWGNILLQIMENDDNYYDENNRTNDDDDDNNNKTTKTMKTKNNKKKNRTNVYDDFLLAHLGYWTDNGAYHYRGKYQTDKYHNMEEALLDLKEHIGIPIRYIQWDDWWMKSKGDIPGILSWEAKPEVFPSGFDNWLDMPLAMYAPEYSGENIWIDQYHWKTVEVSRGSTSIPLDANFYMDLFRNGTNIGMIMFEQDFLCSYGIGDSGLTNTDIGSGDMWLYYMDQAAQTYNITLQLCMPDPYHLLQSTKLHKVTNARATGDNTRNYRGIRSMGQNGLLYYALGIFASRDNVWTTNANVEQTGCGNTNFCYQPTAHLDNAVAVLSNGPYGIADKLGYTNQTLAMYSCRTDGCMLRPRWPLASLDFTFTADDAKGSLIWAAHDDFGSFRWSYIIGVELDKDINITPSRLIQGSIPDSPTTMVAWPVVVGERKVHSITVFSDASPFSLPKSPPLDLPYDIPASSHTHYATAPVLPNGMVMLGEYNKWATMSFGRFTSVDATTSQATFRIVGAPSETIYLAYLRRVFQEMTDDHGGFDGKPIIFQCTFPKACEEIDPHGNAVCRLWIVCQSSNGCTCSNGRAAQSDAVEYDKTTNKERDSKVSGMIQ